MGTSPEVVSLPLGLNPGADPFRHREDESRWQSIQNYDIFLNNGILRSFGLVTSPFNKKPTDLLTSAPPSTTQMDVGNNLNSSSRINDLQNRLLKLCNSSSDKLREYHSFQYNLLQRMWFWKYKNGIKELSSSELTLKKFNNTTEDRVSAFMGSKISLLLLIPLLKSQALMDKELATVTAKLLLEMLLDLPGMSLSLEFQIPLDHLESLFEHWIEVQELEFVGIGPTVMVALSCARGTLTSILKTIRLLEKRSDQEYLLPVRKIISGLPNLEVRIGKSCRIMGIQHIVTWQYDDLLINSSIPKAESVGTDPVAIANENMTSSIGEDTDNWHGLATDGVYLYVTGSGGHGMSKIGTGLHGSLQSFVYHHNNEIHSNFLAYGNGILVAIMYSNKVVISDDRMLLGYVIDQSTLTSVGSIWMQTDDTFYKDYMPVGLTSDGFYFYLIQARAFNYVGVTGSSSDDSKSTVPVYLDVLQISKSETGNHYSARLTRPRILLQKEIDAEPTAAELDSSRKAARLSYLATVTAQQSAPPPQQPVSDPLVEKMTSLGIRLRELIAASFISSGNYVTILTENTGSLSSASVAGSPLLQTLNRHFGTPTGTTLNNSKVTTGTQIHVCIYGRTPLYGKHGLGTLPTQCSFQRGQVTMSQLGATYDSRNNFIWTTCGDYMDCWKNPGHVPPWKQNRQLMLRDLEFRHRDETHIEIHKVTSLLWAHVGLLANHYLEGTLYDSNVGFGDEKLTPTWDIISKINLTNFDGTELSSLLLVLQTAVTNLIFPLATEDVKSLDEIQSLLLLLFADNVFMTKFPIESSSGVYYEASRLLIQIFEYSDHTSDQRQLLANQILRLVGSESLECNITKTLKCLFFDHLTQNLEENSVLYEKGRYWILAPYVIKKLIGEESVQHTIDIFDGIAEEITNIIPVPLASPATSYVAAVVNCLLKSWTIVHSGKIQEESNFVSNALPVFKAVLNHCSTIVDRAIEFVNTQPMEKFICFVSTENILKTSLLGLALPQIFMWLCEHSSLSVCDQAHLRGQNCPVVEDLAEECVQLYVAISHLCDKMTPMNESRSTTGDDWFGENLKTFPFQNQKVIESTHPVKDNVKLRESIIFSGARRLYLKMDPKSATQYDYDKLTVYSGAGANMKRIAEYGGNFYGFGNRTGMTSHWPRDLIKIEGDTVSYALEIRSGRETQTPSEATWGFAFTIFPVYDTYDTLGVKIDPWTRTQTTKSGVIIKELFFVDKLSLASVDAMTCILTKLINGEPATALETEMSGFFTNDLLSKLKWPKSNQLGGIETFLTRISSSRVLGLRRVGNSASLPRMPSKINEMIKPEVLEKLYVLATLKCLNVEPNEKLHFDNAKIKKSEIDEPAHDIYSTVLFETFRTLDSLIRKFIAIATLQLRLVEEVDEVIKGLKNLEEIFVFNLEISNTAAEVEMLALLCDVNFDKSDPGNTISDIKCIVEAFVAEGFCPQLAKTEELVEETVLKLRSILSSGKRENSFFWICDTVSKAKQRVTEVYTFVSAHLINQKASLDGIMEAVENQVSRASSRSQGLQLILKLLECSKHNVQSLLMASLLLQKSKQMENIICSGLIQEVNDLIRRGVREVVVNSKSNPLLHRRAIAILCTIPYKPEDEKSLVSSGLLELLDELCALQIQGMNGPCQKMDQRATENNLDSTAIKNTASLAWAAFQILAHCCSSWKTEVFEAVETESVALPVQISLNVTNHLARATALAQFSNQPIDEGVEVIRACAPVLSEAIQDVLGLLYTLRSTKLGQEIIKQSPCICRLLALLLDPRQPPFIVVRIIHLLSTALPLVETLDTSDLHQMNIPLLVTNKKKPTNQSGTTNVIDLNPHSMVVSLLMSKLADFLVVCGNVNGPNQKPSSGSKNEEAAPEITPTSYQNQTTTRTPPPVITIGAQGSSTGAKAKLLLSEQTCREMNLYLQTHDPVRNFLSGEVAADLAIEITQLLRQLLLGSRGNSLKAVVSISLSVTSSGGSVSSSESNDRLEKQKLWTNAVEQALILSLKPLGKLTGLINPLAVSLDTYGLPARIANAALGVLGSLDEPVKIGSDVWIHGHDWLNNPEMDESHGFEFQETKVRVYSICERTGIAIVKYLPQQNDHRDLSPAKTLRVPLARLSASKFKNIVPVPEMNQTVQREIAICLKNLLLPHAGSSKQADTSYPLKKSLPTLQQIFASTDSSHGATTSFCSTTAPRTTAPCESRTIAHRMTVVRLIAEIRTRAAHVLSIWLQNREFLNIFLGIGSETDLHGVTSFTPETMVAVNSLKNIAKEVKVTHRLQTVKSQVTRLRLLYRDCTKPPQLTSPNQFPDVAKNFPVTTTCLLNNSLATATTTSDSGFRLRRISDSLQDLNIATLFPYLAGIVSESEISFEMTDRESDDDHDRESEYASPMSSVSNLPTNSPLPLEQQERFIEIEFGSDSSDTTNNSDNNDDDTDFPQLVPILFADDEGSPLQPTVPKNRETPTVPPKNTTNDGCPASTGQAHVAKPKPENSEYSPRTILTQFLSPSPTYDVRVFTGPNPYICPCAEKLETEYDLLSLDDDIPVPSTSRRRLRSADIRGPSSSAEAEEDIHELLAKAWEARVFPIIRRRFRNEAERRDGLEQIRTALTMGMIDIARQTVEFLYEENGGIPRDLHFPTLEEMKVEVCRVTIERIKIGMHVIIHPVKITDSMDSMVPPYAVGSMLKTFGVLGEVLEVNQAHELVLVESYVESDGILQRFWYPFKSLERLAGERKPPMNSRSINMFKLHSNLVELESSLTQLYCRRAFLEILNFGLADDHIDDGVGGAISKSTRSIVSLFQELDLGNLEIRSEASFSDFPLNGDLLTWNLTYGAPPLKLLTDIDNPSVLFYKNSEKLAVELKRSIKTAFRSNGGDGLMELTSQIFTVFLSAPMKFVADEIPLDKENLSVDIVLPATAFTLISIQGPMPRKFNPPPSVLNRDPCVHVYGTNGGDLKMYPLVCYPVQSLDALLKSTTPSSHGSISPGPGIRDRKKSAFPSVLVPSDQIFCSVPQGTLPGHTLQVQGIPAELPLALLYCQQLISFIHKKSQDSQEVAIGTLSILFGFLRKTTMPPLIKEWVFMLSSGVLSAQYHSQANSSIIQEYCLSQSVLINRFLTELVVLYEQETNLQSRVTQDLTFPFLVRGSGGRRNGSGAFRRRSASRQRMRPVLAVQGQPLTPPPQPKTSQTQISQMARNVNNVHGFPIVSSYFQALLELCLNLAPDLMYSPATLSPLPSNEPSPNATPARMSSNAAVATSIIESNSPRLSSTQPSQRKNIKPSKPLAEAGSPKSNSWKSAGKACQLENSSKSSPGTSSPPIKFERCSLKEGSELWWFRQSLYALKLLKIFTGEFSVENYTIGGEVVQNCLEEMKSSTSQSRLFVIYGAPRNIGNMTVETSITRGLNETGGIYANELWISEDRTELVVEVRTAARANMAFEILKRNLTWYPVEDFILYPSVSVFRVNNSLDTGNRRADSVLAAYLHEKIFSSENPEKLSQKTMEVLSTIFTNCYVSNDTEGNFDKSGLDETGILLLKKKHILSNMAEENLMKKFVHAVKPDNFDLDYFVQGILKKFGQRNQTYAKSSNSKESQNALESDLINIEAKKLSKDFPKSIENETTSKLSPAEDSLGLSESGFLNWCIQMGKDNLSALWRALLETGHDIRLDKFWVPEKSNLVQIMTQGSWTQRQDAALVTYVNDLASKLRISPQLIHPHEIYLTETIFLNPVYGPLAGVPLEYIRTRFAILQHLNQVIHNNLLPFVALNYRKSRETSIASLLHEARYLFFYNTKDEFLYKVFLHSAHRGHEISPPEVTLDPIRNIGITNFDSKMTMFSHAVCQLSQIPSQTFCVLPSTGSDPPLSIVVKFVGEEVQGIIGSFRHFLATAVKEFQEPALNFLIPCPSSAAGRNKDSLLLCPGPLTYGQERLLECLGQFIGICLRADAPIPITLVTSTWRSLLNVTREINEIEDDLKEADVLTATFLEAFEIDGDEGSVKGALGNQDVSTFEYMSMDGKRLVPLCPGGRNLPLRFSNKNQFVRLVKRLREKELNSYNRVNMILAGLSTILPLPLFLNFFTSFDFRTRVSGSPVVNLSFLKAHTHYQVDVSESDPYVQFFWAALESMTPEELKNFIKFATNQDRLPASCPCQSSSNQSSVLHVPPFPMKLAPIDIPHGATDTYINQRTIRAETCLFLIRLPPYTTYKVTRDQLLFACNTRDDPLSG